MYKATAGRRAPKEESIYNLAEDANNLDRPRTRTHEVSTAEDNSHVPVHTRPLRMHQDSRQVDNLFNPVRGIRDLQKRQGKTPVDHAKANRKAISEQSQMNAVRKMEEVHKAVYNTSGHGSSHGPRKQVSLGTTRPRPSRDGRDFVKENIVDAGTMRKAASATHKEGAEYLKKADYGRVPTYLHERKMELAVDYAKQQAAKEAALIPEGMRIMSEEERLETLQILDQNRAEVQAAIEKLPFVIETPSQISHKNKLERRLNEIEEAKKIFSRPKVLVKA